MKYNNNLIIINLRSGPILAVLIHSSISCLRLNNIKLEVIIDYGFAFVRTYGKITETIDKINRGGYFAVARDSSKMSALKPQEHQIKIMTNAIIL